MAQPKHERFFAAKNELRSFLRQAERDANGSRVMVKKDIERVRDRLLNMTPEVGDAARSETLDAELRAEFGEYVDNLKALQHAIKTLRRD